MQVSLDFAKGKNSGAVPLDKSVQSVGNLAPGARRTVTFRLRPTPDTAGATLSWVAAATTADGRGAQASGTTKVVAAGASLAGVLGGPGTDRCRRRLLLVGGGRARLPQAGGRRAQGRQVSPLRQGVRGRAVRD